MWALIYFYKILKVRRAIFFSIFLLCFFSLAKAQYLYSLADIENRPKFTLEEAYAYSNPDSIIYIDNSGIIETSTVDLSSFTNLQKIVLWKNELKTLPKGISYLHNLQVLNLRDNSIANSETLSELSSLSNLKILNLSGNKITKYPDEINSLSQLKKIDLSFNLITQLPLKTDSLVHLEVINMNYNQIAALPEKIGSLHNLYEIDFQHNDLRILPKSICELSHLEILNLKENPIAKLPDNFGKLQNIEELHFSKHNLSGSEIARIKKMFSGIELSFK